MRTSYREISKIEYEVSVVGDDGDRGDTCIGILRLDQHGKWKCIHSYFPVQTHLKDTVENKDSMVECGRSLVEAWVKYDAQQRFDEKLKQIRETENKTKERFNKQQEDEQQEYWDSLWNLDMFDPFDGEP